ncbi:MAG: tetratricopeptide repeat protein [Myxococcota bacterium]
MKQILTLLVVLWASPSVAANRTVVAVPFAGSQELHWVGNGLAHALNLRIYAQPGLNAMALRQVRAAARNDNIALDSAYVPQNASRLGRQLGAEIIVVGELEGTPEAFDLRLRILTPSGGELLREETLKGSEDTLVALEAKLAGRLAVALGASDPDVTVGAFGTRSVAAWRHTTLGLEILSYQSMSPRSAQNGSVLTAVQLNAARKHFEDAIAIDEDYGEAYAGLGMVEILQGQHALARKHLEQCTAVWGEHQPTAVLATYYMRLRQERLADAAQVLENAVGQHPGFLHARGYLGELYLQTAEHEKAIAAYGEYIAVAPLQPWALAQRGYARSKAGDTAGAIADTIQAVDLLPQSPMLLIELASRYIDAGKLIGAEDALQHALELHPEEGRVYVRLCYVYLLQRKDETAVPLCEKALTLTEGPDRARDRAYAHLNLGQALGRGGRVDAALGHLEQAKALGVTRWSGLETDPALSVLRNTKRYRRLTAAP